MVTIFESIFNAMRNLVLVFFLTVSVAAWAQLDESTLSEISRLEKEMMRVSQESQSTYQQFLMTQELRRNEMLESPDPTPLNFTGKSVPIPNYDDYIQRRVDKDERVQKYTADLDRLYARYKELESEKEALFEKIRNLERKPAAE
ncbi:hypothetical protein [Nitrosomonas sp. JL21]|uniref:hypothetical protein n=1 Tax=Nitrosomonas sp. JL21 TaxID=153949 RepID=UPI001F034DEA|nr:hypothetical protein [Nitrosomonas sp. JL21]